MNANEVIAQLANQDSDTLVHPNDDVNMGQSSNDVIPTAIQVSAAIVASRQLIPSLLHLAETLDIKAEELDSVVKTGRTHLMDAMPITFGQELGGWSKQIRSNIKRIKAAPGRHCSRYRHQCPSGIRSSRVRCTGKTQRRKVSCLRQLF
jgi:fumarate hydratase class II